MGEYIFMRVYFRQLYIICVFWALYTSIIRWEAMLRIWKKILWISVCCKQYVMYITCITLRYTLHNCLIILSTPGAICSRQKVVKNYFCCFSCEKLILSYGLYKKLTFYSFRVIGLGWGWRGASPPPIFQSHKVKGIYPHQ